MCQPDEVGATAFVIFPLSSDSDRCASSLAHFDSQLLCFQNRAIEIASQHMVTDLPSSFGQSFMDLCGVGMAKKAAEK